MESIKEFAAAIVPVLLPYGIKRVAIFGSFARGEAGRESDIDILVEFHEPRRRPLGLLAWVRLERELSQRLGRKVDLVSFAGLRPRLREEIEKEMVVVYEAAE
jgi:predicted nucleotidyltransferase